ncbi:MAG: alpha-amylase, partial [Betaproteobacteria bacterium]|nr:alpha-amylase [Betaproteobacteria bacterium]
SNITANAITVSWSASTDNVGVATYLVLRNGVQITTTAATSYTDTGLAASTSYSYTIKAQDAVGNTSAASSALNASTTAIGGNTATVYYKFPAAWSSVNIHYAPNGGQWTVVPGVAMDAACAGWKMKQISLGSATGLQVVFNNNAGTWDNNNGANYALGLSVSAIQNGTISTTNPCTGVDATPPSVPTGLAAGSVTATSVSFTWAASSDNIGVTGYKVLRNGTQIGTTASAGYTDTGLAAATAYTYAVQAYDAAGNTSAASAGLAITTSNPAAGCQVTFTIANANTISGQNLYVVGNQTALGNWTPAQGFALTIQGSGANVPWTGTVTLPAGTTVQYKYVKWNGSAATWESNQTTASGNREMVTPASCASPVSRNDGNFKF